MAAKDGSPAGGQRPGGRGRWARVTLLAAAAMLVCAAFAAGMQSQQQQSGAAGNAPPPANAWQLVPTPVDASAPSGIEAEREAAWDRAFGPPFPLGEPLPPSPGGGYIEDNPEDLDFDEMPVRATLTIVVGSFLSSRAVLTPNRTIFTEVTFSVEQVLSAGRSPSVPAAITIIMRGGTVQLPDGRIFTLAYVPAKYSIQPQHRYLAALTYSGADRGDFYEVYKTWGLVNGVAVPNCANDVQDAAAGRSQYAGKPEADVIADVQRRIAAMNSPRL